MKTCSKCKIEKPLSDFHNVKTGKQGKHHYCKECMSAQRKQTYTCNKSTESRLRYKYHLTLDELYSMHISQNKKCKICKTEYEDVTKHGGLYVDHCHKTGKVRGLLCRNCNNLLGVAKDDVTILQNAIEYLTSHKFEEV
jgi:hypothetical protein